ncbi:hypothetical protein ACTWNB_003086 [Vibrio cholerae]
MDFRFRTLQAINWLVSKVPFCFSKKMGLVSQDFYNLKSREATEFFKKYEVINTYSFLDPRLNWKMKAVSSVCTVSAEQVNRIHQWKKKTKLHRSQPIGKASINDNSWFNLGYFRTNKGSGFSIATPLGMESDLVDGCDVYLFGFSDGTYYLSMYWHLNDRATLLVKDVDISKFENRVVKYFTCNPFNVDYGSYTYVDKLGKGKESIGRGFTTINDEINLLEKRLKKIITVKSSSIPVRNIDVLIKEDEPYFLDKEVYKKIVEDSKSKESSIGYRVDEFILDRTLQPKVFIVYDKPENKEFLLNRRSVFLENLPFEQFFIKSENLTQKEISERAYWTYESMSCHISDSHHAFAVYQLFNQKFNQINDSYAEYILHNNNVDAEKHYDVLYRAYIEIDELERQISSTISEKSRLNFENHKEAYMDTLFRNCSNALDRVREVKQDIAKKKTNANELVQAGNLRYQKKNSQLVVLLVIIQIFLAYLALNDEAVKKLVNLEHLFILSAVLVACLVYKPLKMLVKWLRKLL